MNEPAVLEASPGSHYDLAGRSTYLSLDLDRLSNNINILRRLCSPKSAVIAVVKANAYGHGSVEVCKCLLDQGVRHFGVATPEEGAQLRLAGIGQYIQVFGNSAKEDIPTLVKYNLTPTAVNMEFLQQWKTAVSQHKHNHTSDNAYSNPVVIKVDTGMSRNGCQVDELQSLVQFCQEHGVEIHSIMTHFSQAWDNPDFTRQQLDTFLQATHKYRKEGIKVHVANSSAIINGYATDLDFVRPGICVYGLPPDSSPETVRRVESLGLRPVLSWWAHPTLIKQLPPGRAVGYDKTYITTSSESIATLSLGYADGYNRLLSGKGVVSFDKDNVCPVVGRVSMDAITVKLKNPVPVSTNFNIITDDFTSSNSVSSLAATLNTIPYEIVTSLSPRLPRVYISQGKVVSVSRSLVPQ